MPAKEAIDIETLLFKAYAQYRVETMTPAKITGALKPLPPSSSCTAGLGDVLALGTRVDTSRKDTWMFGEIGAAVAGYPDDILTVHDEVLALPDQFFEWQSRDEVSLWTVARAITENYRIERADNPREAHPDLMRGQETICRLERVNTTVLVIAQAKIGQGPIWGEGGVQIRPVINPANGKAMKHHVDGRAACLLEYFPSLELLMGWRAKYLAWHAGLEMLVRLLNGKLDLYDVQPPRSAQMPWLDSHMTLHRRTA